MEFIAYTVKGLENIVVQEIKDIARDVEIKEVSTKKVVFSTNVSLKSLSTLKTVDDLHILINKINISAEDTVTEICSGISEQNYLSAIEKIKEFRLLELNKFSLTVGTHKNKFKAQELKSTLSNIISDFKNWEYEPLNHSNFDIRVFCEKKTVYISVRLTEKSLYFRDYREKSIEGALRPTIASAMVKLVNPKNPEKLKLVDSFCGSGTILIEAFMDGFEVYGGDLEFEAVKTTKLNFKNTAFKNPENIRVQDATRTKWRENYFDMAVSNLPWDSQIKVVSITDLYVKTLKEYKRILKDSATLVLLVHKHELLIKHIKKIFGSAVDISIFKLGYLGQTPVIVVVKF